MIYSSSVYLLCLLENYIVTEISRASNFEEFL